MLGKTLEELQQVCISLGLPKFVAAQLSDWLYKKRVVSFAEMSNLAKTTQAKLAEHFSVGASSPQAVQTSRDGTKKYLFAVGDNQHVETVMIPEKERKTLCVSTQIGCRMGCRFCVTGTLGFNGNLTAGEIINQIRSVPESENLTNLVFMGMGEPFDNIDATLKSLQILTASWGFAMSPRRITVSSIGIIPAMKRFLEETECHLAISLHSPVDEERQQLIPLQKTYPIKNIISIIRAGDLGRQRRISFEYILFKGMNDTPKHVKELSRLLNGLRCRVNLIRFHQSEHFDMESPDEQNIRRFAEQLNEKQLTTTIRTSRGEDISAACGLLSGQNLK
ncbi:MAG: 23S rRNA (adenine(2503)-C(2))-methyltransferase RlmN [Bacteroidales bacterium]|nr:23S rRNA (adenine(2503)-C(2))-methyltransferase RlmN [Bacteroidales bacterium]